METFDIILWGITCWTLIEGGCVALFPRLTLSLTQKLFPKWGKILSGMASQDLRSLGAIEAGFGLLLGAYLLWAG